MGFGNGRKTFSLPAHVRCALTDVTVTSEEEQTPSGKASGPADTLIHMLAFRGKIGWS